MGGRIGVLTVVEGSTMKKSLKMLLCTSQPINPKYVSSEQVKEEEINHEREVLKQQALNEGKPENIVEKWLKVVYVNIFKKFVQLIKTSLKIQIKQLKLSLKSKGGKLVDFVRYEVGEGMENVKKTSQMKLKVK